MLSMDATRATVVVRQSLRLVHLRIRPFPQFPHPLPPKSIAHTLRHQFIIQIIILLLLIIIIIIVVVVVFIIIVFISLINRYMFRKILLILLINRHMFHDKIFTNMINGVIYEIGRRRLSGEIGRERFQNIEIVVVVVVE
ncbi:hypothetical protein HYC85_009426 [Camellia sinensis]|uniref:Uncharacterized protein n=1 Tax=Camellia sinensis TaxID=4442 RepID=A0A7J7HEY5_CAMSI|nr:hypothetical protein HYC85_009426 [Camellia sinensis]